MIQTDGNDHLPIWIKAVRRLDAVEIFFSRDDKEYIMMRTCWLQDNCPDDGALGFQAAGGDVHQLVQPLVKVGLVFRQIGDAGQVDGDHAHGAGGLPGAEEDASFLSNLSNTSV